MRLRCHRLKTHSKSQVITSILYHIVRSKTVGSILSLFAFCGFVFQNVMSVIVSDAIDNLALKISLPLIFAIIMLLLSAVGVVFYRR